MKTPARMTFTSAAAAALVLIAAPGAFADPSWTVTGQQPTQRGREATFTVTVQDGTLDDNNGYVTLESPAFAKAIKIKTKRFREGRDDRRYAMASAVVLCDITPGTYPVALKDHGEGKAVRTVDLTVVPEMDPGNRDFCAGPKSYDDAVDKTSEAALQEDEDSSSSGMSTGTLVAVSHAHPAALRPRAVPGTGARPGLVHPGCQPHLG
ncbi:hypothetical protein, partial [Streptomyces sp. NPDC051173]|uniref:hypothetical protein n=1 Tax=Streptomyces sp. NPDC051173 TaxID=3155164 RepID=UPI00344C5A26